MRLIGEIVEEEYTVAVYQKGKAFVFKGYKDGTELFSDAIHLAKKFTREKAEKLKEIVQRKNPTRDVCVMQIRTFY